MCLIAWNWQPDSREPLLLVANRDEFYARPTLPLHWWEDGRVLAGRDLTGGGTWLGITRDGRVAALTNYRDPANFRADAPSRGSLVAHFLQGNMTAVDYLQSVLPTVEAFNPFNLLVFDGQQLMGLESRRRRCLALMPGIGAVSNADFDTGWPKLVKLKSGLKDAQLLPKITQDVALWALLRDEQTASDNQLPDTGIPIAKERALSAAFIHTPDYGTRASTVLRIDSGGVSMAEHTFDTTGLRGSAQFRT